MKFAYVFVLFSMDTPLQDEKKIRENSPILYPTCIALYDPAPKKQNNKQTNLRELTNIDLGKMVSDCTIYIHIFPKNISPGKAPGPFSAGGSMILSKRR